MLIYKLFSNPIKEKILKSPYFKEIKNYDLDQTISDAHKLSSIGSLVYGSPHPFICLLQKLESLNVDNNTMLEKYHGALREENSTVIMFFVFYFRMTAKMKNEFNEIKKPLENKKLLVKIVDENNESYSVTIKEVLNMLQSNKYVFGIFMKSI
ncbi:putative PRP38 protein [Trachipleistophora hominis]|uniref:Pre-mRNA-splicing factor 38 n=1 Tax=Trachipleistophora hominis TaxID=72359 RepID=L7JXS8_TRAHO|nr:putative PRP38 protein [Trachipleistophora hominis]